MTEWIQTTIETLGYFGVALLTFAENLFPPLPSEVVMPLAGFTAARGELDVVLTALAGAAGSLAGTSLYYFAGRAVSEASLERWAAKHGKWLGLSDGDFNKAKKWFDRQGRWALLLCRLIPGLRTIISLPAGLNRTPPGVFFAYSAMGVAMWTAVLTYAGFTLGDNYEKVSQYLTPASWIVAGALAAAFAVRIYRKRARGIAG